MERQLADLEAEFRALSGNRAFWLVALGVLAIICLSCAYSGTVKAAGTMISLIQQMVGYFAGILTELVGAVRSLLGFTSALKYVFFGKFSSSIRYVLTNYAIIFISVVYCVTTSLGLREFFDTVYAVALAFAIQTGLILATMSLVRACRPQHDFGTKRVCYYSYNKAALAGGDGSFGGREDTGDGADRENPVATEAGRQHDFWGILRRLTIKAGFSVLIVFLCGFSIFFSYLYVFENRLDDKLVYENGYNTLRLVDEGRRDYSADLKTYYDNMGQYLLYFLDLVDEAIAAQMLPENAIDVEQENREMYQGLIDELRALIYKPLRREKVEEYSRENARSQRMEYEAKMTRLIQAVEDGNLESEIFSEGVAQGRRGASYSDVPMKEVRFRRDQVNRLFSNFLLLTEYFTTGDSEYIKFGYSTAERWEYRDRLLDALEHDQQGEEDNRQAEKAQRELISRTMWDLLRSEKEACREVPDLETIVFDRVDGEQIEVFRVKPPDDSRYQHSLETMNKAANRNILLAERAMAALVNAVKLRSWFVIGIILFLIFLEAFIVPLCFIRDRLPEPINYRAKRNLIRGLFLRDEVTAEQKRRYVMGNTVLVVGGVFGTCLYLTLRVVWKGAVWLPQTHLIVLVGTVLLCLCLASSLMWFVELMISIISNDAAPGRLAKLKAWIGPDDSGVSILEENLNDRGKAILSAVKRSRLTREIVIRESPVNWHMGRVDGRELEKWRKDINYKVRVCLPERIAFPKERLCDRSVEECYYIENASAEQGKLTGVLSMLCEEELASPVWDQNDELAGFVMAAEWMELLKECVIMKYMNGYGVSRTFEEDLKDYEDE